MDDKNNPTIPAQDQYMSTGPGMPPPPVSEPIMPDPVISPITGLPVSTPITETTTTTTQPSPSQFGGQATTTTSTTMTSVPPIPEVQMPPRKPKNKSFQVFGGILALLLVVGVAFGSYYFTRKLREAEVPTAPPGSKASETCSQKWFLDKTANTCVSTSALAGGYNSSNVACSDGVSTCAGNLALFWDGATPSRPTGGICYASEASCVAAQTGAIALEPGCSQKYYLDMASGNCVSTNAPGGYSANQVECNANAGNCSDNLTYYLDGGHGNGTITRTGGVCFDTKEACDATATNGAKPGTGDNTFTCTAADAATHPVCKNTTGSEAVNASWQDGTCIFMICPQGDTNGDGSCGLQDTGFRVKGAGNCFNDIMIRAHRLPPEMCYQVDAVISATDNRWCWQHPDLGSPCVGAEANMSNCAGNTVVVVPTCTDTSWSPDPALTCVGTNVTQTSNCPGHSRTVAGTKLEVWGPDPALTCVGTNVTQNSTCGKTRSVAGTKVCEAACTNVPAHWSAWGSCSKSCGTGSQSRTCIPDTCPGQGGTCTGLDGGNTTRACNTTACDSNIVIEKKAYQNESGNSAGSYTLNTEIDSVAKNQTFVYSIALANNDASNSATGVVLKDPLTGQNQEMLSFVDKDSACDFDVATKTITCNTDLNASQTKLFSFRMKVASGAINGTVIKNIATATHQGRSVSAEKDLLVDSVVGCNNTCTSNDQCSGGLICDAETSMCRNNACVNTESCTCAVAAAPRAPQTPRVATTRAPQVAQPTVLPETGILDFPGVAAFGGGLLLAIIGILLAL